MTNTTVPLHRAVGEDTWLTRYYVARAAFSLAWVGAAIGLMHSTPAIVAALLLIYPAWDAVANLVDAQRNGGTRQNLTQVFNAAASLLVTVAVGVALTVSMNAVLGVFGVWAAMAGLLQLATAARRRRSHGGQWPMILSGVQSTAAGVMFLIQATAQAVPQITDIAPYAAFGGFYFLVSALWLAGGAARRRRV